MGLFDIFKSKKKVGSESERRAFLQAKGRITDGTIVDSEISESGDEIVHYYYAVQGANFESWEILTAEQRENQLKYAPGAKVGVRYHPKQPGNSILA